jgi:hypothetical protein
MHVAIEMLPIAFLEHSHIKSRIRWVKDDSRIVLLVKISKQMEQCFQMSLTWLAMQGVMKESKLQ